uniref:Uncharacterized protein n=1 Tax=Parascaris equorum TaxID=6256 RepID=A0A914RQK1_PAREQ
MVRALAEKKVLSSPPFWAMISIGLQGINLILSLTYLVHQIPVRRGGYEMTVLVSAPAFRSLLCLASVRI